jgi:Ni/Fe-hydrogenase 1 B-type cytochrome subunit
MPMVITHWINLICIIVLAFTGFYIHYPWFPGWMSVARGAHFFFMYTLIINLAVRLIFLFVVKTAGVPGNRNVDTDIKSWLPQKANRGKFFSTIAFYLFMRRKHPTTAKYNSLQKIAYILMPLLIVAMAWTGFSIYGPYMDNEFFRSSLERVGGPHNMRIIHYFLMWVMIIFTLVHAYLANIFGMAPTKLMFAWKETPGLEFDENGDIVGKST